MDQPWPSLLIGGPYSSRNDPLGEPCPYPSCQSVHRRPGGLRGQRSIDQLERSAGLPTRGYSMG